MYNGRQANTEYSAPSEVAALRHDEGSVSSCYNRGFHGCGYCFDGAQILHPAAGRLIEHNLCEKRG